MRATKGESARSPGDRERAALAAALDPIITIDAGGTILSASDSVFRVLGWTPAELAGQNVKILMPEPHHSAHDGYLSEYLRTGRTSILNRPRRLEALRKDGSLVPIELCISRAQGKREDAPLLVGIIRDMSAYAAAERSRDEERVQSQHLFAEQTSALLEANARLRMADRMASIGTLAAGLGHDMNNVLLPVRARLNALKASGRKGDLSHIDLKHVEEIQSSVAYLQQLADGLHFLALDPETAEDQRGGGGATDLRQWWSQAGALLSKAVPRHVRVAATFPPGLPLITVPSHGLTQAVLNLIVNAGEAIPGPTERKRRSATVRVWAECDGPGARFVRFGVSDNGTGMTDEVQRRAFEMFFTTKPRGLGTGLGLALVRKIVEKAGGSVEIQSVVDKGTTVLMTLPAARSANEPGGGVRTPNAAITVEDGRAGAIMRHMAESGGAQVRADGPAGDADLWITDAASTSVEDARNWRRANPQGRLVLFGAPNPEVAKAWRTLAPIIIESADDFEAVRSAIATALSDDPGKQS